MQLTRRLIWNIRHRGVLATLGRVGARCVRSVLQSRLIGAPYFNERFFKTSFTVAPDRCFNIHSATVEAFGNFTGAHPGMTREMQAFLRLCEGSKCLLDVGALYGVFSLVFTRVNPSGRAVALEPSAGPLRMLRYHASINPELDILPLGLALGRDAGTLRMKREWEHLVACSDDEGPGRHVDVPVTTMDAFVKEHDIMPDLVKIDTEGFEHDVLQGGRCFLERARPVIALEIHPARLATHGVSAQDVLDLVRSLGYRLFDLDLKEISDAQAVAAGRGTSRIVCAAGLR